MRVLVIYHDVCQSPLELRSHQPKLIDIAKDPDYVKNHAKAFLQRVSFHNLEGVAPYFKAVLGVEIFESEAAKTELVKLVETRHHLIHRNGRKNDGTFVTVDENTVGHVKALVQKVFDRVEAAFSTYIGKSRRVKDDDVF